MEKTFLNLKGINNYRKNNNNLSYKININDALEKTNICFITVPTQVMLKIFQIHLLCKY